ncbi:geranylgeranylglycerol-phosphate geranylgeranyltransferase [Siphonobacter curvatus]|uniref:Prenyltransferase n=1 Tax=Siphonobacter curvatus TaxID=2094562 RepID=A0A2S7IIF6_9BACT|nr:geranylgeranylglycerol-phosphate geranylgeranyltransferase [Siphonobacter curvatus]PQA56062.1 prenyltransferase [Siphonobacter curvatus]
MRHKPKPTSSQITSGFLRLIRWPNLLILAATQYLVYTCLIFPERSWTAGFQDTPLFWLIFSTTCIAAAGYIINDYYDIKIDLINKPDKVIIGRYLKRRWAMGINLGLNFMGVAAGWLVDKKIFLINACAFFFLWLYSNHLKRLPFWGNLMVAFLTALSLIVLAVHYQIHEREVYIYALFAFTISLIREIIKDMEDVRGDASFGCQTLPIRWGLVRTKYFLEVLIAVFLVILFVMTRPLHAPTLTYIFMVISVPILFMAYRLFYADTKQDFAFLSSWCKYIMMAGVLTMLLV